MEPVARLVVVALVVLPLVVLALRGTRRGAAERAAGRADSAHDEYAALLGGREPRPTTGPPTAVPAAGDTDRRRLRAELAAVAAHRDGPVQPADWPSRFSAEIASWTAWSRRFWASP